MTSTLEEPPVDASPSPAPKEEAASVAPRSGPLSKTLAVLAAVVSVSLAVGVIAYMARPKNDDMQRPTQWQCQNYEICGKSFVLTIEEFRQMIEQGPPGGEMPKLTAAEVYAQAVCGLLPDEPLWCPHCGSYNLARGYPCPHCDGVVSLGAHGAMPDLCPFCGKNPAVEPSRKDAGRNG